LTIQIPIPAPKRTETYISSRISIQTRILIRALPPVEVFHLPPENANCLRPNLAGSRFPPTDVDKSSSHHLSQAENTYQMITRRQPCRGRCQISTNNANSS